MFFADFVDTTDQQLRGSVLGTNHVSPAVNPNSISVDADPAVYQIMLIGQAGYDMVEILLQSGEVFGIYEFFEGFGCMVEHVCR